MSRVLSRRLCWLLMLLVAGCATHADRIRDARRAFYRGDLLQASQMIEEGLARKKPDQDVLQLDKAMVRLAEGKPDEAEQLLRTVRDRFDELEQKHLGELALSMLTDDQVLAYAGEDYERVLIRAMLALANLMQGGEDALAYALQMQQKQQQIIDAAAAKDGEDAKLVYKQVALAPYLHGVLAEQTHRDYDLAARSYLHVASWQPEFSAARFDLHRAQFGRHSAPGNGVLYVFALVGRGPYKEEKIEVASSVSLILAEHILRASGMKKMPPSIAPVKVPALVVPPCSVQSVVVSVNGRDCGRTETITDVAKMAKEQYDAAYPQIVARAIARRVVKKSIVYAAKEAVDDRAMGFLLDIGNIVWDATESADTRCWALLPAKIQVLRLELPAGMHQISLRTDHGGVTSGNGGTAWVQIVDGANTYVLANFPEDRLVGSLVTNRHGFPPTLQGIQR